MIFATDISNGVNSFLKTKISLNKQFEQYSFQGKWTSEIDESYFDNQITKLQNDLLVQLKSGKNNVQFLADLLDIIWNKIEWYNENKIHKFSFIEDIEHIITFDEINSTPPPIQKYSHEFFSSFKDDGETDNGDLLNHLLVYADNTNNYTNKSDFERANLLYVLQLHFEAITEFYNFIYKIQMNLDTINFENLITLENLNLSNSNSPRCNLKFDKITSSVFFHILMDSGVLFFDKDKKDQNKFLLQQFIQDNFNYSVNDTTTVPIIRMNKEFTKFNKFEKKDKQIEVLTNLISLFEENLAHLNKIYK